MYAKHTALVGLALLAGSVDAASSTCEFRFEGYLNISESPTWTLPAAEPYAENSVVLNEGAPFVYKVSETESYAVNCTVTSWQYMSNGTWETALYYPDEVPTNPTEFQGLFSANGSDLLVAPVPASLAPALSDSLYGRTVQVDLVCDTEHIPATVQDDDSCVIFEVEFTNYSPQPDISTALFRFYDPAVPAFELPPAQPISPGDIRLNVDNPITDLDGTDTDTACNGDIAEYLGEDGEWYFWYTGSDGNMYNLTHVFYAANTSHLNIATIQKVWSYNMEAALYNRTVRLMIHCTNDIDFEEGYVFFNIGDSNTPDLEETCEDLPALCAGTATVSAAGRRSSGLVGGRSWITYVTYTAMLIVGAVSAWVL